MTKKAKMTVTLVPESEEKLNKEIEEEIFQALTEEPAKIPWMEKWKKLECLTRRVVFAVLVFKGKNHVHKPLNSSVSRFYVP